MELRIVFDHIELYQGMLKVLREHNHFFESDIPEDNIVTEEKRLERITFFENYKPAGCKGYEPPEHEHYQQ